MNSLLSDEEHKVVGSIKYMPAVSIIQPFEFKKSLKKELLYKLKVVAEKVEQELSKNYPAAQVLPVMNKLHHLISNLSYDTHKKGIAIFVSPLVEKVFYLDLPVEEKLVIDESFEIRDLIYSKKLNIRFLVLLLSGESSRMYLGRSSSLSLIKSEVSDNIAAYKRDMPEKMTHFTDPAGYKEVLLNKFLYHMDERLSTLLKAYSLPVFVMGAKRTSGHFKKMTKNEKSIAGYIHGNFMEATEAEIHQAMEPHLVNWRKIKEQEVLQQLEKAANEKRLIHGIKEVWSAASREISRLLVVEKDFIFAARQGANAGRIYKDDLNMAYPFYIKDAVDDIIEKVLENEGDVEFVDNGVLKNYGRIALIQHYRPA